MSYENYAEEIKQAVSMRDVAEMYGFSARQRTSKILCPFHNDTKPSMQIYSGSRGYYCFVCGHGGDVIDFVQRLFGLDFKDACKKLNDDFNLRLSIGERQSYEEYLKAKAEWEKRQAELEKQRQKQKLLEMIYHAAYNRFTFLDIIKETYKPKTPYEEFSREYIYACKHIDMAWNDVKEAERNLDAFIKKKGDN